MHLGERLNIHRSLIREESVTNQQSDRRLSRPWRSDERGQRAFVHFQFKIGHTAPACYGYYILPTYPSDLAAINFDRSGTTRIGAFIINHSFILPGLIGVLTSCVIGFLLAKMHGFV